jgi:hypothetical protein
MRTAADMHLDLVIDRGPQHRFAQRLADMDDTLGRPVFRLAQPDADWAVGRMVIADGHQVADLGNGAGTIVHSHFSLGLRHRRLCSRWRRR